MKTITLSKGYVAIIDDDLLNAVSQYKWYCNIVGNNPYAVTNIRVTPFKQNKLLLHRFIYELLNGPIPEGCKVMIKDRNTLNCQADNLYMAGIGNPISEVKHSGNKSIKRVSNKTVRVS